MKKRKRRTKGLPPSREDEGEERGKGGSRSLEVNLNRKARLRSFFRPSPIEIS